MRAFQMIPALILNSLVASAREYVGDDTDQMIDEVSGDAPGGYRKRKPLERSARGMLRSGYLGFGAPASVVTLANGTFTDQVQRGFQAEKLVLVPSATGFVVTSIRMGDVEHIVGSKGVMAELFDKNALLAPDDDFEPVSGGISVTVVVNNTTAGTLTCGAAFKGHVPS